MNIIYELNPPKILQGSHVEPSILITEVKKFLSRAAKVSEITRYIHLTDSVLGFPRISSVTAAHMILNRADNRELNLTCSIRTRDRNMNSIIQSVADCIILKVEGLLFIQGDKPNYETSAAAVSNTLSPKPTEVIRMLNSMGFGHLISLDLSIPNKISNVDSLRKKIESRPRRFVTQSVASIDEIRKLKTILQSNGCEIVNMIPCVMVPSLKNQRAATMIGLDWSGYEDYFFDFIGQIKDEGINQLLLTSPNSFDEGIEALRRITK